MTLTERQQRSDLFCLDHLDEISAFQSGTTGAPITLCVPSDIAPVEIAESITRITNQRKAAGLYAATTRLEAERQERDRDWKALADRLRSAENDRNAMETLWQEEIAWNVAGQLMAWLCGALTMLAALYALGHIA